MRGPRLHQRVGLEGLPARPGAVSGAPAAGRLAWSPTKLPEPIFTPSHQGGRLGMTRAIDVRGARVTLVGPTARFARREHSDRRLPGGRRSRARARDNSLPTPSSKFGLRLAGAVTLVDEVLHARQFAILAGRPVSAGPRPAVVRQTVRPRLARRPRWDRTARPALPDDVVARHAREVHRGLRAVTGEKFAEWQRRTAA